ncbi:MAG: hypothetical protein KIT87_04485 [Anaerolineae bacterium]|nr:hypothetical protein [Anaerolineae bacterium]
MTEITLLDHIQECWAICRFPSDPDHYFLAEARRDGQGQCFGPYDTYATALAGLFERLWQLTHLALGEADAAPAETGPQRERLIVLRELDQPMD